MNINAALANAFKQVTISSTAVKLTALPSTPFTQAEVDNAGRAVISINSGSVRIRYDGGTPTVSAGHLILGGSIIQIVNSANLNKLLIIRNGGTDAEVAITLEG